MQGLINAKVLFETFTKQFQWHWIAGCSAYKKPFAPKTLDNARSSADLVGYLNYIRPFRVQVLGNHEINYLTQSTEQDCQHRVARIAALEPPVLILTDGQTPPKPLLDMCNSAQIPMFATQKSSAYVIENLRNFLFKLFAPKTTLHGVFLDILGIGVLITGESGIGKSELGLELITRGHGLVADDAVDINQINPNALEGRCPDLLQNLLEVRGIGLLDIRAIFGEASVRRQMRLRLIVHIVRHETMERDYERLPHEPLTQNILGIDVRKTVIQTMAGRNTAVLVEAAVRSYVLQLRGIDTFKDFAERQRLAMLRNS